MAKIEAGSTVVRGSRNNGVHVNTLYKWRHKHACITVCDVHRRRSLEDENRHLKQIDADKAVDNVVLKDLIRKY